MKRTICLSLPFVLAGSLASAATFSPVDLSTWSVDNVTAPSRLVVPQHSVGSWAVEGAANDRVRQSVNSSPTIFYEAGRDARATRIRAKIEVDTTNDDDFIGFVLGYNANELNGTASDFLLVDWKQAGQTVQGAAATAGLALSRVSGDVTAGDELDFFGHRGSVTEITRATTLGSTGWQDRTAYTFDIIFASNSIRVDVNGATEIQYALPSGSFSAGAFGFYNTSQDNVVYSEVATAQVPLPATLPLLLAALGGAAALRRARRGA